MEMELIVGILPLTTMVVHGLHNFLKVRKLRCKFHHSCATYSLKLTHQVIGRNTLVVVVNFIHILD